MASLSGGDLFSNVDSPGNPDEAARYLAVAAERAAETRRAGYELLQIREQVAVLDVGCGLGEVCADLVSLVGPSGTVVGIDASAELITRSRQQWSDLAIRFEVGDAEALAFDDATFDAVRAERVVQHLEHPDTAIREMARVVRPGGRVLVADAVHDASVVATEHPQVWEAIRDHGSGAVRHPRAGLYLKDWMQAAGLDVQVVPVARVLDDWPRARALLRVDDGAALAVRSGAISAAAATDFTAEQEDRSHRGAFALSVFFVQALGTKDS